VATLVACLSVPLLLAPAALADGFQPDSTPLPSDFAGGSSAASSTGGATGAGTIVRGIVGLAIVLGVIYGLHWLLKTSQRGRRSDGNTMVEVVATTPLAQNKALHLVRAGGELLLIGSSESAVTPIRVYSATEAVALGLEPGAAPIELEAAAIAETPALERAVEPRGVVGTIRSWTVRV
jgi:flagellar protein FliO/FliZ